MAITSPRPIMTVGAGPGAMRCDVAIVTGELEPSPSGGRALLTQLNRDVMDDLFGASLLGIQIARQRLHGWKAVKCAFNGHVDGLNNDIIAATVATLGQAGVRKVLIDGSNFGVLADAIKRNLPGVEVTTFFHNCEARFFLGVFRQQPGIRASGVLLANYIAERLAVHGSDKRICLNARDSELLLRVYGRGATHLSAMAMRDRFPAPGTIPTQVPPAPYVLFVGGAFYANIQGIRWYADHVAAQVSMPTYVVGNGFERWREELEQRSGNLRVVGAAPDLAPWYLGASAVVAPIFDGSGMKTKVAEALMFGKRVVGTPEAFAGYENFVGSIGESCTTATDFVTALGKIAATADPEVDPVLRRVYESNYSFEAAKTRLAAILGQ